jgi:hypothetical protein
VFFGNPINKNQRGNAIPKRGKIAICVCQEMLLETSWANHLGQRLATGPEQDFARKAATNYANTFPSISGSTAASMSGGVDSSTVKL